ncbi:MAG: hypothetical protein H6624_07805 [Bdellovibrionaceae bacterium]|nr:hypothetical protein [Bdellovibrionales bacterium]MCB9084235.1 hypothetical protein [Pseudobdellovibrionaceae bacterium]
MKTLLVKGVFAACLGSLGSLSFLAGGPQAIGAESSTVRRDVNLEWEEVEFATSYQIRLTRKPRPDSSEPSRTFKTNEPKWSGDLKPGFYTMELRSYDDRGVPGEWSEPSEFWVKIPPPTPLTPEANKGIRTKETKEYETRFSWKAFSGASRYKVEIESEDGSFKSSKEVEENKLELDLPVAKIYKWRVYALMGENLDPGEIPEQWRKFSLVGAPLEKPNLQQPLTKYVQELNWKAPEFAQAYDCIVQRRSGEDGSWRTVSKVKGHKESPLPFDLSNPTGFYKLKVQARSYLREKSEIAEMEFEVRGGIRSPAALEEAQLRDSLERPSHIYYIASYLITQVDYTGTDRELNSVSTFNALGGTGRLGVGYQNAKSLWGGFGIVDLSGFDLGGERYTFAAAEIHGTYKQYWGKNQVLYGAGIFLKQLPDLRGSESTGFTGLGKVQNYGPHIGVQLWRPVSSRLGFQAQARAYVSLFGSAPNGQSVAPALSYQAGVLGTYRINSQMMGYAGYVYRLDNSNYEANPFSASHPDSFAESGDLNSLKLGGHYLNLKLEYSY